MAATPEARTARAAFLEFLALELAPREGRALAVAHIVTACVLTVVIAMIFRIPEPTYMAYIVFLISKDERTATVTSAVGGQAAVTLAILLTLGLMLVDLSEPALRVPAMALSTFIAMYTVRTFALGPITYLAGFVVVMLQSVVDDVPSPEALTHVALWLWVVLLVPILITVLVNLLFGQSVALLTRRTVDTVMRELEAALQAGDAQRHAARWRELIVPLLSKQPKGANPSASASTVSTAALHRLIDVLLILEAAPERSQQALDAALTALRHELVHPSPPAAVSTPHKHPLFAPDAFTNPAHWQFALKTTLAVLVVYFIYTMLDWPGLRTSIVTCFFVALGSVGETVHKLVLRISGALIGGLTAGVCIVFVLPHMTDIGQLSLLIAVVSAGAAWVATSGELLAYAGLQIAFAFFLGILQDYAPATDLTVLRDRIVGILLGNVVMTLVFTLLWPESAVTALRGTVEKARLVIDALRKQPADVAEARVQVAQALVRARHFDLLRRFELSMLPNSSPQTAPAVPLADIEREAGDALVATYERA